MIILQNGGMSEPLAPAVLLVGAQPSEIYTRLCKGGCAGTSTVRVIHNIKKLESFEISMKGGLAR